MKNMLIFYEIFYMMEQKKIVKRRNWRLVQNKDPNRTSKVAKSTISKLNIKIIDDWPDSSPGLTCIGNLRKLLK